MRKLTLPSIFALIGLVILCQPFAASTALSAPAPTAKAATEKAKGVWEAEWNKAV